VGSHHSPSAHGAELTAGVAIVTTAIGASTMAATDISRQMIVHIAHLVSREHI
jgi:hypothetical protein